MGAGIHRLHWGHWDFGAVSRELGFAIYKYLHVGPDLHLEAGRM